MKILLSAYACKPNHGSEEGYGWNWAKSLAAMEHEVWVLTRDECQGFIDAQIKIEPIPNLHFVYLKHPQQLVDKIIARTKFNWQFTYFRWQHRALTLARKLDREFDFDLIHHVTWGSVTAGSRLWELDKPFVFGPVGGGQTAPPALKKYFLDQWRNEALRSLLFNRFAQFNWFFRQTVRQADLVLATNIDTYELVKRAGGHRVELFFDPGLPEDYFPKELPVRKVEPELKLLWVGSLIPRKGLPLTLEALSRVSSEIPLKLTIVGSGSQSQTLPQWIKEFGLEKVVECPGRLPWLEVKQLYLESDAFFFTTLRDSCPTQYLEAMSYGLPIVTLNLHGARKFIPEDAGIKVEVTTAEQTVAALAQAIEHLYTHPQERATMGKIGYEFAQTQTWSNKTRRVTENYHQLLKQQVNQQM
ncbi:MAG: glycosyltransferase family 4 protein [Cyanobacteria bacterium J06643_13]